MMMKENCFFNYLAPNCNEFHVAQTSVLCDSFTTPSLIEESGDFEWV